MGFKQKGEKVATMENYQALTTRYEAMNYRRCGRSGLLLPPLSLGLWKNFGSRDNFDKARQLLRLAFDAGITHFDLANNYGPDYGTAELTFGRVMQQDFRPYRDVMIIATKAGYDMWPGPYGNWGSKKYLVASLEQSLRRLSVDYVDIFYHHRPDPETPLEETMGALEQLVRSGKALYVGLSNYSPQDTARAKTLMDQARIPLIIHQSRYSLLDRKAEALLDTVGHHGLGLIVFSPLAQGLLSGKYQVGIPEHSRAAVFDPMKNLITAANLQKVAQLEKVAQRRGQTLSQMALAWVLRDPRVTSAIIGVSKPEQLMDNLASLKNLGFDAAELAEIEAIIR